MKALDAEIMSLVQDAVDFALESPAPDPEEALEDVFSD